MAELTATQVWDEIEKQIFAIVGMVTAKKEARTVGVVYTVREHKFYFGTSKTEWKTRHIAQNPEVSMTIPIAKRIPYLPWIKIPAATITFAGVARVLDLQEAPEDVVQALHDGIEMTSDASSSSVVIEVTPKMDFITYGVGVSLQGMRDTEQARGRIAVN